MIITLCLRFERHRFHPFFFKELMYQEKKDCYAPSLSDRQGALYLVKSRITMQITENVCHCDGFR